MTVEDVRELFGPPESTDRRVNAFWNRWPAVDCLFVNGVVHEVFFVLSRCEVWVRGVRLRGSVANLPAKFPGGDLVSGHEYLFEGVLASADYGLKRVSTVTVQLGDDVPLEWLDALPASPRVSRYTELLRLRTALKDKTARESAAAEIQRWFWDNEPEEPDLEKYFRAEL